MKMKKSKIVSLMLAVTMLATLLPIGTVSATSGVVFSDNFDAETTKWYKDPLLVPEEDGTGNMMTIEGETTDKCSMIGVTALTTGVYELSFDLKPAINTKSWFNIYNGSALYHTVVAAFPENGSLTFQTGRYADTTRPAAKIATGLATGKWYGVKAIIDAGSKKIISVEITTENGTKYTHGEYNFDAYATTWKEGTQIDRIALYTGAQSTTDRPYIDNVLIQEYKAPFELADDCFTIKDADGNISSDLSAVLKESNEININFGKDVVSTDLTTENIFVENVTSGDTVGYTGVFENQTYKMTLSEALIPENTYKVTVKAGIETTDKYVLNADKVMTFTVAEEVDTTDLVFGDNFNASTTKWYKDPLLVPEEDGTGNMLTIEGETTDWCAQIGVSPALTTGIYEFAFDFNPAKTKRSWFNIFNGSSLVHTVIATIPDENGTVTFQTGRYADATVPAAKFATGMAANEWYAVKAIIDIGNKKVISVEITTKDGATYSHGEYNFDAYATTWKTGTQIDRLGFYGHQITETDRPYLDNVAIKEYKYSINISDEDFTVYDVNGEVQEDLTSVSDKTNKVEIFFGKDMVEENLTDSTIFVKDSEGNVVASTASYDNQVYTLTFDNALIPGMTYTVTVKAGLQSEDGYIIKSEKTIEFTVSVPELDEDIAVYDDFNYLNDTECKWYKDKLVVTEEDGNGGMLTIGGTNNDKAAQLSVAPALTSGMYEISYKFKPSVTTPSFLCIMNGGSLYHTIVAAIPDGTNTVTLQTGRPADANQAGAIMASGMPVNEWYSVNAVIDVSNKRVVNVKITDKDGKEYTHAAYSFDTYAQTWKTGTQVDRISLNGTATSETDRPCLDDLVIREYYQTPELTANSVVLYAGETVQEDYQNVNPLLNKITLDFGTGMDGATLNTTNIKVVDKASNAVAISIAQTDRGCTITFPQGVNANTEYTLSVSTDVANKKGTKLLSPYTLTFKTAKASLKAPISSIKVGETEITELSQLAKDNQMVIEFAYENSTKEAKTIYVIVAYYEGNRLVTVDYITRDFTADITMGTYQATHTVRDLANINLVKVMIWDGLTTIRPISDFIDID